MLDPLSQKLIYCALTSSLWNSPQSFLKDCLLGYNPQVSSNKIFHFFLRELSHVPSFQNSHDPVHLLLFPHKWVFVKFHFFGWTPSSHPHPLGKLFIFQDPAQGLPAL